MGKSLIITEKPSVAKDITAALSGFTSVDNGEYFENDSYICTHAVGHILSLKEPEEISPEYKRWRLANLPIIPEKFELRPIERQAKRLKVIKSLINRKDVDMLINACDAAREGELIFREIVEFFGSKKPIKRLWLQSMTKTAIKAGFAALADGKTFENLASAAACRTYSDWLIGMNATRALTLRLKTRSEQGLSWSAGRVQTPTLALLVNRELDVLSHIPKPFWKIEGSFAFDSNSYKGIWYDPKFKNPTNDRELKDDRIFDEKRAQEILEIIQGQVGVASEVRKSRSRKAPLLFDLTSLQRDANRRFSWSAARTLKAAQRCYEAHKVLTYPRTSSKVLPEDYVSEVDRIIDVLSSHGTFARHAEFLKKRGLLNKDKVFDNAGVSDHFAIIPTGEIRELDGDDAKLFDLVTRQFLAVFYPPAVYEDVERITVVEDQHFSSKPPPVLKEPGWLAVFEKEAQEQNTAFPPLIKGQDKSEGIKIKNESADKLAQQTKPPSRINEAGLLGLMENAGKQVEDEELSLALQKAEGLGTAATRADIIENLKVREYVDSSLRPTSKGIRLIDVLKRISADSITSAELTAKLEMHLSEVEKGTRTSSAFMDEVKELTTAVVMSVKDFNFDTIYPNTEPLGRCPICNSTVYEKAWFYACEYNNSELKPKERCAFIVWKDFYGRYIDRTTVHSLLENGHTIELDGFKYQDGNTYKAVLELQKGQVVRKITSDGTNDPDGKPAFEVDTNPIGACPIHKNSDCKVIETQSEFICTTLKHERETAGNSAIGFSMPRSLCKKEITRKDALDMITEGETTLIAGFISKRGRPFRAKLKLQQTGGFTFEFPERAPAKKATVSES